MRARQLISAVFRRSWGYIAATIKSRGESPPIEDDPVGEFLDRKRVGIDLKDDAIDEVPQEAAEARKAVETPQALESANEKQASSEKVEEPAQQAESPEQVAAEAVPTGSDPAVVSEVRREKKVVVLAEDKEGEAEVKAVKEDVSKAGETGVLKVEAVKQAQGKEPQNDAEVEKLLDVFRTEENPLDPLSVLSKDLSDMNVYSLLEESKEIATKMRLKKVQVSEGSLED